MEGVRCSMERQIFSSAESRGTYVYRKHPGNQSEAPLHYVAVLCCSSTRSYFVSMLDFIQPDNCYNFDSQYRTPFGPTARRLWPGSAARASRLIICSPTPLLYQPQLPSLTLPLPLPNLP